ncbi:MAG: hypothetical protein N2111_14215, partial [Candidatus Sumerlaeaceae bacterium]|nr:hypothetical protein [Candidatus Sumerlaeaceae bacterium]
HGPLFSLPQKQRWSASSFQPEGAGAHANRIGPIQFSATHCVVIAAKPNVQADSADVYALAYSMRDIANSSNSFAPNQNPKNNDPIPSASVGFVQAVSSSRISMSLSEWKTAQPISSAMGVQYFVTASAIYEYRLESGLQRVCLIKWPPGLSSYKMRPASLPVSLESADASFWSNRYPCGFVAQDGLAYMLFMACAGNSFSPCYVVVSASGDVLFYKADPFGRMSTASVTDDMICINDLAAIAPRYSPATATLFANSVWAPISGTVSLRETGPTAVKSRGCAISRAHYRNNASSSAMGSFLAINSAGKPQETEVYWDTSAGAWSVNGLAQYNFTVQSPAVCSNASGVEAIVTDLSASGNPGRLVNINRHAGTVGTPVHLVASEHNEDFFPPIAMVSLSTDPFLYERSYCYGNIGVDLGAKE